MELSRQERVYVEELCHTMTDERIAMELTRIRGDLGIRDSVTKEMVMKTRYARGIKKERRSGRVKSIDKVQSLSGRLMGVGRGESVSDKEKTRLRVLEAARWALEMYGGDLIEIGCHKGKSTVRFCELAREFGRKLIAVDPWELGTQNCEGGEREQFLERTKGCEDVLEVNRVSSLERGLIEQVKGRELAFAYVDGLHTVRACKIDIETVSHSPVIGVDDIRDSLLKETVYDVAAKEMNYGAVFRKHWREGYLTRED
tara:strand:+ start:17368 stop:18138 length:771 start_codon:yes stop_codon:yes gene_type:complete